MKTWQTTLNALVQPSFAIAREMNEKSASPKEDADALYERAKALPRLGQFDAAADAYRAVLDLDPDHLRALIELGYVLIEKRRFKEAREMFWRAVAIDPEHSGAYCGLGTVLRRMGQYQEASAAYRRSLALRPGFAPAISGLGRVHLETGDLAAAQAALTQAMTLAPDDVSILYSLALASKVQCDDPVFARLKSALARETSLPIRAREQLHFALAKVYDEIEERDRGFRHQLQGNAIRRARSTYDESATLAQFENIRRFFSTELMRSATTEVNPSSIPIFVLGMPRSGSTLIEQIVSSHPKVIGVGEFKGIPRLVARLHEEYGASYPDAAALNPAALHNFAEAYLQSISVLAPNAARIVDKQLGNFLFAGLLHLAFPNARIIHTMRDPVDTCLSCFSQLFAAASLDFTYDLGHLGRYYKAYSQLMDHWRTVLPAGVMLDVQYESVVADFESEARRILAHCQLEWDDACLNFHTAKRAVKTASVVQVRQPIYRSSVGRWRPNVELLQPLLSALGQE